MAVGFTQDGAVQDQIDSTVKDAIKYARANISKGTSAIHCSECGHTIPESRRRASPGTKWCVPCLNKLERVERSLSPFNRRGSKDSQLR